MKISKLLLRLVVTLAILFLVYRLVPFSDVVSAVRLAELPHLAVACLLVLCMHLLAAWRLGLLFRCQGLALPYTRLFGILLESLSYRVFLPGGTIASLTARFFKLKRVVRSRARIFATLAVDRIFATLSLVIIGIVFALLHRQTLVDPVAGTLLALAVVISGLYVGAIRGMMGNMVVGTLTKLRLRRLSELGTRGFQPLTEFRKMRPASAVLVASLSFGSHLVGIVIYMLVGTAIGIDIPLLSWGWIRSLVILTTMLPVSLLGLGVREASLLYLLKSFGVPGDLCIALAILIFSVTILFVALLGALVEVARFARRTD